jgi:mannose-6-phosphate isomerase
MTDWQALRDAIRRPLPLPYHPVYRFYQGGAMTRRFRSMGGAADDWWSEDWVGSVTEAGNADPDGRPQGLSNVAVEGQGSISLRSLIDRYPEEMLGASFVERWGGTTGVLVKLLSPSGPVPLHAHPTRAWAEQHLGSRFGKTEAWILLETPGDGSEPAYAGIGFHEGVTKAEFRRAVDRQDVPALRSFLHRTQVQPGDVMVASAGVPHFLGPRILFIEVQEPTDFIVIPEWSTSGVDQEGATMGLGWDLALDMIEYGASDQQTALARARQTPSLIREEGSNREVRLFDDAQGPFFDATGLEVGTNLAVEDGRFYVGVVSVGHGTIEGDFGTFPVRQGDTFACAASLSHRFRAGREPLEVVRCMGPRA